MGLETLIFAGIVARVYAALFAQESPMQSQNRIFDDLAKVAGGALSTLTALKEEIEAMVRDRFQRAVADADFVRREEFEAVKAVASAARAEQEKLEARVVALEAQLNAKK
jgi:BMFP domain-containing protein YqiC